MMTSEEIIRELRKCADPASICRGCPYDNKHGEGGAEDLMRDAADLIESQSSKIRAYKRAMAESAEQPPAAPPADKPRSHCVIVVAERGKVAQAIQEIVDNM